MIKRKRLINENTKSDFMNDIQRVTWDEVFESNDANDSYNNFIQIYSSLYDRHFPYVERRIKTKRLCPWMTPEIHDQL